MTLPNRTTVAALALLIFASAMPTAPAQAASGSDVYVERIDLGLGVADRETTLRVFVKNGGSTAFDTSRGWQLWLGYKAPTETRITRDASHCIDRSQQVDGTSGTCYRRFAATDPARIIPAGGTKEIIVPWSPDRLAHGGVGTLVTAIEQLGCEQGALGCYDDPSSLRGPSTPDGNPSNNVGEHAVFVKTPAVRAVPLRGAPDYPGANVNSAWRAEDVKAACNRAPDVTKVGCKAKPDTLLVFEYLVINEGNAGDTFVPTLVDDEPTSRNIVQRGFQVSFQPPDVIIPEARGSKVVRVEVLVPKGERVGNDTNIASDVTARVRWRSLLDERLTTSNLPAQVCTTELRQNGLCQDPSFPSLLIDAARSVNVTTLDARKQANVSQIDEFNFTINNTGNVQDTFLIKLDREVSSINDSWVPTFPASVTLEPFTQATVKMTVLPPANATKGVHPFELTVQSAADTEGTTLRRLRFEPDLQQEFGLTGYTPTPLLRVVPAKVAPFVLHVVNTGNGPDNVTLNLENVPFTWQAQLSNRTIQVPPFGTSTVYLNVTAPENAPADAMGSFFVNVTSQGPSAKPPEQRPRVSFQVNMTVQSGSNIRLTAPVTSTFIDPGATHEFDVVLRNTGNARDNFTIAVERDQSQLAWAASVTPAYAVLDPLQQVIARVSLRAPTTAAVGETSSAFVTATSTASKSTFQQVKLEGRVSGPDLFVSTIVANATQPYSGDPLEVNVVLGNGGNKAPSTNATLKVYFQPANGAQRVIAEKAFAPTDLVGGRRIAERILWDTTGIEGDGTLIARIDELDAIPEIDDSAASNEATRALTLRVFDIRLTPAQGQSGRPGEKVSYSEGQYVFLAEYRGNQPTEPVDIYIESEHGWGSSRLALALPRGSVIPILADVTIPSMPGVARDTLRVTIVPSLRPESVVTATTTTTVLDEEKPRIRSVAADPDATKLGVPITIRAVVEDATGLASVRAFVHAPTNETQSLLLEPQGGNVYATTQTFPAAGTYRYYVEATDGSDNKNVNTSRDVVATFTIAPGSAPVIALGEGQSTTIRSGTLVRLNITDPLGISKASYAIKGVSYDLPRPFSIDTSSFQAGTLDVTVTAHNVYGVATSQQFTFVIDNTPPGITGVTLEPARPKANEEVTVRIEVDTQVSAVDVLVKKDGQVLETLTGTRQGAGVFTVKLTPPEGEYALDVTAKDAAGNVKLQEAAARFSAKPASPFDVPGPGLLLVALAALAVALATRRKQG